MTAPDVRVRFGVEGVSRVTTATQQVSRAASQAMGRTATATLSISNGIEQIARSGNVAGESLRQIAQQAAGIGFGFGAGGAIAGALVTLGIAAYDALVKPLKEAQEEARSFQKQLEEIARGGDLVASARRQQHLLSGDPFARRGAVEGETEAEFIARSQGITGLRTLLQQREDILGAKGATVFGGGTQRVKDVAEVQRLLNRMVPEYEQIKALTDALAKREGERAQTAQETALALQLQAAASEYQLAAYVRLPGGTMPGVSATREDPSQVFAQQVQDQINARVSQIRIAPLPVDAWIPEWLTSIKAFAEHIAQAIAATVGGALSAGFDEAFASGSPARALGAFAASALQTIGGVFKDIGTQTLLALSIMKTIKDAIISWNPEIGAVAAVALIALGSALQAMGGRVTPRANFGSYSAAPSSSAGAGVTPGPIVVQPSSLSGAGSVTPVQPIVVHATIIGAADPTIGRQLREIIARDARRVS